MAKAPSFLIGGDGGLISGLHAFYNESENFQPSAQRYSAVWEALPPPGGETKDYGILLKMFDDKLTLKATKYETSQRNVSGNTNNWTIWFLSSHFQGFYKGAHKDIRAGRTDPSKAGYKGVLGYVPGTQHVRMDTDYDGVEDKVVSAPPQYWMDWYGMEFDPNTNNGYTFKNPGGATHTQDVVAEGMEFELTFNPTNNWRIAVNATKQEAVQTGAGQAFETWLNETPFFDTDLDGTLDTPLRTGLLGYYSDVPRTPTQNFTQYPSKWWDGWNSQVTVDNGKPTPEIAKWAANFITNYKFTDGRLKGWSVGGTVRWRAAAGIGYGLKDGNDSALDYNKVIYGDEYLRVQTWFGYRKNIELFGKSVGWDARLNIRNLLDNKDLIPVQANPDGTIVGVRVGEPRMFEFVNTLSF